MNPHQKGTALIILAAGTVAAIASAVRTYDPARPEVAPGVSTAGQRGFEACAQNFFQGFAPRLDHGPAKQRALCFADFAVLHSGEAKSPLYAAEHLTPQSLADARDESRTDKFYEEARLPSAERAQLEDFRQSGCDRGHLAAAAQRTTPAAMAQSFSLANMVCQAPKLNRGAWAKSVEKATRAYVARGNEVYVITGPLFQPPARTIGPGRVWVPAQVFKLVYDPAKKRAWAYVADNADSATVTGTVSYAELVSRTRTNWLPPNAVSN